MKVICDRELLHTAVNGAARAVTSRSTLPVLEGIHFKADGFQLTLTGYDLELAITTTIEANVLEPGELVLSAKLFADMVSRISSEQIEIESNEKNATHIKGGITEFDILGLDATDYPALPQADAEQTFTMQAATLRSMIEKTLYAVSQDNNKPAHTGEMFSITKDSMTVVALDGFRLAIITKPVMATKEIDIIIPQKTLSELNKLLPEGDDEVHVAANRRFVVFTAGNYTIISRLIEGEFLDYRRVVPEGSKTTVIIDTHDFMGTIERASLIITERLKNPLRITFDENVVVRCQTTLGRVVDELSAEIEGDSIEIGFNNRYLLDALRYAGCEKVKLEINGALSPVKIMPVDSDEFLFLVLPVRFKND